MYEQIIETAKQIGERELAGRVYELILREMAKGKSVVNITDLEEVIDNVDPFEPVTYPDKFTSAKQQALN